MADESLWDQRASKADAPVAFFQVGNDRPRVWCIFGRNSGPNGNPMQWRKYLMRPLWLALVLAIGSMALACVGLAQQGSPAGPYKVLKTAKVGGEGGFDYIFADVEGRRLYIPRTGPMGQLTVYNLDTLEPAGTIAKIASGGAAVDPKSHHGFSTTKPITMWDSTTLQVIKTIDVDGRPDGIMFDPYNELVWVLSHAPPHATVIDAKEG